MRIVNKKIILASIMLVVVTTGVLICRLYSDKETQLDSVKLKEVVNSEMFAIMLEQDDGSYKESADNTWPEDMQYNAEKSGCVDINGNKLDGVLTFDSENNLASVNTTSTSYCYLYFSLPPLAVSLSVTNPDTPYFELNVLSNKNATYCLIKESVSTTECFHTGVLTANQEKSFDFAELCGSTFNAESCGMSMKTVFTFVVTDSSNTTVQESVSISIGGTPA